MEENNNTVAGVQVFDSPEAMMAAEQPQEEVQPQEAPVDEGEMEESPYVDPEAAPVEDQDYQEDPDYEDTDEGGYDYTDEDIEDAVLQYMSERLGTDIESFDYFDEDDYEVDERLETIARFVEETGRSPEDWFRYQQLNPTEMDDATAIRVALANEYPNLSYDELNALMSNNYKLDPDQHSDQDIQTSRLQMKIDAQTAREAIEDIRNEYAAPVEDEYYDDDGDYEEESFINEDWLSVMSDEVDSLEGLEFDLGGGRSFTYALDDEARGELVQNNAYIDEFFEDYIDDAGSWDFDKLNSHMAVLDNIDAIVASAYRQGVGDGQKGLVEKAANVSADSPGQSPQMQTGNPLADQVRTLMKRGSGLTFNI